MTAQTEADETRVERVPPDRECNEALAETDRNCGAPARLAPIAGAGETNVVAPLCVCGLSTLLKYSKHTSQRSIRLKHLFPPIRQIYNLNK
jgi:hypothetical protein